MSMENPVHVAEPGSAATLGQEISTTRSSQSNAVVKWAKLKMRKTN